MKTTRDFDEQVLRKWPEITLALCLQVLDQPVRRDTQPDGRVRFWAMVTRAGEAEQRALRVVTFSDGTTIHNAFFDRGFRRTEP